jgi:adenylate cyclase
MEYLGRSTQEANAQARQQFEKALALDSQYAEAYAYLSYTYWLERVWSWSADPQTLERALALAQQAVALDDTLPRGHAYLSYVYVLKQQYDQAIMEGERGIALDPNNADLYARQANVLNFAGRPEEALRMLVQAMRLHPHYPPVYSFELGQAYRLTGRYTEAIAASERRGESESQFHACLSAPGEQLLGAVVRTTKSRGPDIRASRGGDTTGLGP